MNINHPCSVWARESLANWNWLRFFVMALGDEYEYRYNREHNSAKIAKQLIEPSIEDVGLTPFAKCVPEEFRGLDAVSAYRMYFINYKNDLKKYTKRDTPDWWK